ncbi:D-2-hydroxyacid dehydrogenase [Halospeciosus flavus]|uniref:D-2-hydroxyacid dehydrogenase n=1 Tax=Halospeciosus flavus TaxID=3032283 RepID=A0ABD5Z8H9_9EURY|nr:D-2-hydroxyacid dehydrogenase [Halospeciosus flavus]
MADTDADHPRILVPHHVRDSAARTLDAELTDRLGEDVVVTTDTPAETVAAAEDAAVVVADHYDADLFDAAPDLRWVQAVSAGVDDYDLDALRERDVVLTNASGVHAEPIAEQVLGSLLTFARNIHTGIQQQEEGVWEAYGGHELRDATVGVVGLGAIGGRVAEHCDALGVEVIGTKRDPSTAPDAVDEVYGPDDLDAMLARSDYLVLACPLTEETRGLVGREELEVLPEQAVLVNVARGEIVDQDALVEALQNRRIRGAALDVFEEEPLPQTSPLWDLSRAVVTPHMAGSTPHYYERVAAIVARNYERFREGALDDFENRVV